MLAPILLLAQAQTNSHYLANRASLKPAVYYKLPIGAVKPKGWVLKQVRLQADGYAGHLTEISRFLKKEDNAWLSPSGEGKNPWEEVPYWLRGFGDLGWVLGDARIQKETRVWIEAILKSQRANGYFGPDANLKASNGKPDVWPNMLALYALQSFQEATADPRVIPFMTRYFRWQMDLPDDQLLTGYWESLRAADNEYSILWLYNRTGEPFLLDLLEKFHKRSRQWSKGVVNMHGVNFAQGFREPAAIGIKRNDPTLIAQAGKNYSSFRQQFGQVPGGLYGADENARKGKTDPRQAAETCAMVEMMWSAEWLLSQTGDPAWAERCEDIAFNSLPAAQTADMKALRYLTSPNMPQADAGNKSPGLENGGKMVSFDPTDYRCCQHNTLFGWPYYAQHMWMATNGNGLAPLLYGPSTVSARVGSRSEVTIEETTNYPFEEKITFKIAKLGDAPYAFSGPREALANRAKWKPEKWPLVLRIPSWCKGLGIFVNGKIWIHNSSGPGSMKPEDFVEIDRVWKVGDVVTLNLPMRPVVKKWPTHKGAASVNYGPLTFSLRIAEEARKQGGSAQWPGVELYPNSAWNYGLVGSPSFKVVKRPWPADNQPFTPSSSPIAITTQARQIPEWQLDFQNLVPALGPSPAKTSQPVKTVELIPMGAARLRISVFPTVSPNGTLWKTPLKAKPIIPTKASHRSWFDTTDACSDGLLPGQLGDDELPRFTWWDHKGTTEWVQYDFPTERTFSQTQVYWYDDTGRGACRVPASWRILYLEGSEWKEAQGRGAFGIAKGSMNTVDLVPFKAKSVRIEAKLREGFSSGILEWVMR